jgi:hypothetical protein
VKFVAIETPVFPVLLVYDTTILVVVILFGMGFMVGFLVCLLTRAAELLLEEKR